MLVRQSFDCVRISIYADKATIDSFITTNTLPKPHVKQYWFNSNDVHMHKVIENLSTPIVCKKKGSTWTRMNSRDLKTDSQNMDESNWKYSL